MEMAERGRVESVAMEFPVSEGATSCSPPRMPRRLLRKLSESKTSSPSSVEEIEAKLRGADLRRQKFYENLSSKARPKPRSPLQCSFIEEDLGQRLEAKLQAAEKKRLSILTKAQMRLAKLGELRQAAKVGVEMRFRKECADLNTKVESRVQKAEANRMLLLKAYSQRRSMLRERSSQSLMRRMARESKYKERMHAAISQKRAAAEKKRLGLLEAEKRRARAKVLQARKIAKLVSHQREIERREMQNKLEDKLQRAKRQRAEYLMQRGKQHHLLGSNWNYISDQADILSSKLARCWRQFCELKKTSLHLANAYYALHINERSVKSMPFEQLALLIESIATLRTTKELLDRLESRYKMLRPATATSKSSNWDDIDHLLKRVASPKRRSTPRKSTRSRELKIPESIRVLPKSPVKLARYQVRIVLCAYMILGHPDAVFSGQGDRETALAKSAERFIREFELLVRVILDGPVRSCEKGSDHVPARRHTFRSQLAVFDSAWCSYLNSFVVWKVKDAQSLEEDLVRAACQLEVSMIQTCKMTPEGETVKLTHDMKAIQKQVTEDQNLLREKVHHLSGDAGIVRMENALSDTRTKYFLAKESGSPIGSPVTHSLFPSDPDSLPAPLSSTSENEVEDSHKSNRVKRSLFMDEGNLQNVGSFTSCNSQSCSSSERVDMENELIVNEIIHGQHPFLDDFNVDDEFHSAIKGKVRETMEKAFWDGIMESIKQDKTKYSHVVELMREVRDELSRMVPQSWKQEIMESIDLDILSQVLSSGKLDMNYLGKILNFALITLRKLSAPANEDNLKLTHMTFLDELAEIWCGSEGSENMHVIALVRGLRFILEQIQELKEEISKARLRMYEPFLRGPAAAEYLRKAFTHHYGPPPEALVALPITKQWLSSVADSKDQEWNEHETAFTELMRRRENSFQTFLPSTSLRTGGSFAVKMSKDQDTPSTGTHTVLYECKGEKVDLFVRLGLLKLVTGISGITQDGLPETQKLNLLRLRAVQARMQKIIVIATSILVLRQTLLSERTLTSSTDMENLVLNAVKSLSGLLESSGDAGIKHIIETISKVAENSNFSVDVTRLQSMKEIMARMLFKSLQEGDNVFTRVSHAIYMATRAVVLGGTGVNGRELAEAALWQVGAGVLVDEIVAAASTLVVVATVSVNVHGPWYAVIVANM